MFRQMSRSFLASVLSILLLTFSIVSIGLASPVYPPDGGHPFPMFNGLISLDVNPSLELTVENGIVLSAYALNDDGQRLLLDVQTEGKTAPDAVQEIVKAMADAGYLAQNKEPTLMIAVSGANSTDELASALLKSAKDAAADIAGELEIRTAFVSTEISNAAAALSMSSGKYLLMKHIAEAEGISLEEAIAQYGQSSISELLAQFTDAKYLFEEDTQTELGNLTPEQLAVLEAAFATQKEAIIQAEKAFHEVFQTIKQTYRVKVQAIKKDNGGKDPQAIQASLDQLKEQMMAEYNTALSARDGIVAAARATFLEAITEAAIPKELLTSFFNWHANKEMNTQNQLRGFLKEFIYHGKDSNKPNGDGQEKQGKPQDNPDKKNEDSSEQDHGNDKKDDKDQGTSEGGSNSKGKHRQDENSGNSKKTDGEIPANGEKKR